ncbi:uncharacterized protein KGF55_002649 [Candida pseudojiufengensis]|uniref:uncharacterized protein n=1 Tax=Candida pseudojiufengensis TaxID=497109 RepID=UPI00222507F5|nr:uncharacterized protein KGF55_002649 [Candida pseudojiufengensis]KAI5963769.1 hypothetical protein KGF55_002649 [Candida pseudojiufengensis]
METIKSKTETYLHDVLSNRSAPRLIDPNRNDGDEALLNQIGYKQELRRHYSTFETFGIAFSIMSLLPSIASILPILLESGLLGCWLSWLISSIFILSVGFGLSFLGSSIPTSGGLYYYTNYYSPDSIRVPLSFFIGCANSLGLIAGACGINYGFAVQVLSAVSIQQDGKFEVTDAKCYGVFAASVISTVIVASLATKQSAKLQAVSVYLNVFLVMLFVIAVPIGYSRNHNFNSRELIFSDLTNYRDWPIGWSVCLSLLGAVWVIGAFDSVIHCSEECKSPQRSTPIGILGSIGLCGVLGLIIVTIIVLCVKDGDVGRLLESSSGSCMAQIIYDALGKKWCVAFMSLIALGQYFMSASITIVEARMIWSFNRDCQGFIAEYLKFVDPKLRVPVRSTIFAGVITLLIGLLVLIGPAGSNALFSLGICSNSLAFLVPILLVLLPYGRKKFIPGPFWFYNPLSYGIMATAVAWLLFVIMMCLFPDNKKVDKETMNYTVVINVGTWILSLLYYFIYGYKIYKGPKSNLDDIEFLDGTSVDLVVELFEQKELSK